MRALTKLALVGVLVFGGVACGNNGDDTADDAPVLSDNANSTQDEGTTGGSGTGSDADPSPLESPKGSGAANGGDQYDTGGGAIYDQTPSVAPNQDE